LKYQIFGKEADKIQQDYNTVFKIFIPNRMEKMRSNVPYIHTSPLSNWGKKEDYNSGSQHYWGVWHGSDPIEDFALKSGRFNAEYGFQSFPQMSTLKTFADSSQMQLDSDVMMHHQKSYVGNKMMAKQADRLYGPSNTFDEFVFKSQLAQSAAVSLAVSAHRIKAPFCMGTIFWQLNDCWAAPTWSSIDYFGNWKPLQYRVKHDFQEISILEYFEKLGEERYYLSSTAPDSVSVHYSLDLMDLEGNIMYRESKEMKIGPLQSIQIGTWCSSAAYKNKNFVAHFNLFSDGRVIQQRTFSHLPLSRTKSKVEYIDFKVFMDKDDSGGVIEVRTSSYLHHLFLTSIEPSLKFSKNDLEVLPGTMRIGFSSAGEIRNEDIQLNWL
jgi:beta-mannosidase